MTTEQLKILADVIRHGSLADVERAFEQLESITFINERSRADQAKMERDAALTQATEMWGALESVMIGGNHLASMLLNWLGAGEEKFPPSTSTLDEARKAIDDTNLYDGWVCWRAIMLARAALNHSPGEVLEGVRREAKAEALEEMAAQFLRWEHDDDVYITRYIAPRMKERAAELRKGGGTMSSDAASSLLGRIELGGLEVPDAKA